MSNKSRELFYCDGGPFNDSLISLSGFSTLPFRCKGMEGHYEFFQDQKPFYVEFTKKYTKKTYKRLYWVEAHKTSLIFINKF